MTGVEASEVVQEVCDSKTFPKLIQVLVFLQCFD